MHGRQLGDARGDPPRRARHPRGPDDAAARAAARAPSTSSCSGSGTPGALPQLLKEYDAQVVSCSRKLVSRLLVHRVHRIGGEIWVWTVDRPKEIERLLRLEVDGICSDDPASHGWA